MEAEGPFGRRSCGMHRNWAFVHCAGRGTSPEETKLIELYLNEMLCYIHQQLRISHYVCSMIRSCLLFLHVYLSRVNICTRMNFVCFRFHLFHTIQQNSCAEHCWTWVQRYNKKKNWCQGLNTSGQLSRRKNRIYNHGSLPDFIAKSPEHGIDSSKHTKWYWQTSTEVW